MEESEGVKTVKGVRRVKCNWIELVHKYTF